MSGVLRRLTIAMSLRSLVFAHWFTGRRKQDVKRAPLSWFAVHFQSAPVRADNSQRGCQSETPAGELGREERLEYPRPGRLIHAAAGILHFQEHVRAALHRMRHEMAGQRRWIHLAPASSHRDRSGILADRLGPV